MHFVTSIPVIPCRGLVLQKTAGHAEHEFILFDGVYRVYDPTGPRTLVPWLGGIAGFFADT